EQPRAGLRSFRRGASGRPGAASGFGCGGAHARFGRLAARQFSTRRGGRRDRSQGGRRARRARLPPHRLRRRLVFAPALRPRGGLRSLRSGRAGTDALVSAATVASLVLRENVVALTVLWLLNIGEYLQDLTLRRTRRAISELLRGSQDTSWIRLTDGPEAGTEVQVPVDTVQIGDEVVIHDHVAIPVDGDVVEGEAVVDQSAITGETLPVSIIAGGTVHAGSVVLRGR